MAESCAAADQAFDRFWLSYEAKLAMVFKLTKTAEQKWRKLKGHQRPARLSEGVRFKDRLQEDNQPLFYSSNANKMTLSLCA